MNLQNSDLNEEPLPTSPETSVPNGSNNNHNENHRLDDVLRRYPAIAQVLSGAQKYIPFLLILISKAVIEIISNFLLFLFLLISFKFFNKVVIREVAKQSQRNIGFLLYSIFLMVITIFLVNLSYSDLNILFGLIFIPIKSLTIRDLLLVIAVGDNILKLITIAIKIIVTMLPIRFLPIIKRGKVYQFIEATSQLYRCCVPIQPWSYYMLESFQDSKKVIGVFLSAAYVFYKGSDLMDCLKLWWTSSSKLLQNVALGTVPSEAQLAMAGNNCPICHDEYATPVLLQCQHIFCEACVVKWLDREQSCPLCRAILIYNPAWRDGSTTKFIQLF